MASLDLLLLPALRSLIAVVLLALPGVPGAAAPAAPAAQAAPAGEPLDGRDWTVSVSGARSSSAPVSGSRAGSPPGIPMPATGFRAPVGGPLVVLRRFDPPAVTWGAGHRGVDLGAAVDQEVLAPADGVVTFAARIVDRPVVVVSHGSLRSTLEPVAALVPVGTVVTAGQAVGRLTADAGHCAPAACLHWGVLRGDTYLDPLALLGPRSVRLWPTG